MCTLVSFEILAVGALIAAGLLSAVPTTELRAIAAIGNIDCHVAARADDVMNTRLLIQALDKTLGMDTIFAYALALPSDN
jgi:hypothetical protein